MEVIRRKQGAKVLDVSREKGNIWKTNLTSLNITV
jgi:hypothetical protein